MELFNLSRLELYSPGNKAFLIRSIELLRDELIQFDENIRREWPQRNLKGIRQVIHKIKPSVELFQFPEEYWEALDTIYGLDENFTDYQSFEVIIEKINIFTSKILDELNTYLKLNQ
ncbi:MAG: hypothetical protein K0R65_3003 [Crocinitomicaceae bacterium]|jgi:hypothetical protein|nr:hypothetical protein [Crocinitomicaceae bacterium]